MTQAAAAAAGLLWCTGLTLTSLSLSTAKVSKQSVKKWERAQIREQDRRQTAAAA